MKVHKGKDKGRATAKEYHRFEISSYYKEGAQRNSSKCKFKERVIQQRQRKGSSL